MKLQSVTLERIKSYDDRTTVGLGDGVTAILGENGTGKSTIAEAVGFALFDSLPHTQEEFVREGESSGTVWVSFEAEDETQYTVKRHANRAGYEITNDETGRTLELEGKDEIIGWLESAFHIDREGDVDLSTLWERCIGVPQTRFLSDFRDTEGGRREKFDPLLGIDVYEHAFNSTPNTDLKDPIDELDERLQTAEQRIQHLDGRLDDLPAAQEQADELRTAIETLGQQLEQKQAERSDAQAEFDELDKLAERQEQLQQRLNRLNEQLEEKGRQVQDARTELREARDAAKLVEENTEDYERFEAAETELDSLREQEETRDELETQRRSKENALREAEHALEQTRDDAETARQARERMDELEADYQRYEELDEKIEEKEPAEAELDRVNNRITEIQDDELPAAEQAVEDKRTEIADLEAKQDLADEVDDLQDRTAALNAERDQLRDNIVELKEQRERLLAVEVHDHAEDDVHGPECPTCNREMSPDLRDDVAETIESDIEAAETRIEEINETLPTVNTRLEEANAAQEAVAKLDIERERLTELESAVTALEDERNQLRETQEDLEATVDELEDHRQEQTELEAAHTEYREEAFRYRENQDALDAEDAKRETVIESAHSLARIDQELQEFDGLDDDISRQQAIKEETREGHQAYIANKNTAETVDDRRNRVTELYDAIEGLERERRAKRDDLAAVEEEFDQERYAELDNRISDLNEAIARIDQQISDKQDQLDEVETTIERLETIAEQRDRWQETHVQLERDHAFAEAVRTGVRDAGPKMRELIASRIGERANTIYQTLRGTGRESLTWDATYQIVVRDGSQRKPFSTLSGGEKMAAALAIRLAIMEQVSPLDIAFLDEPTANLDSEKKANLVRQLETLDAFEQLCVVSHDHTFESMTEYTITLEKANRETVVVSDAG